MVDADELRALTQWCADHDRGWRPAISATGDPAIVLQLHIGQTAWSDMMLVIYEDVIALLDGRDGLIATAHDVMSALEAIDVSRPCNTSPIDAADYVARWSEPVWNKSGSAST